MSRRSAPPSNVEESIYNLIPSVPTSSTRPSLYRSKYPHDTPPTASTFGKATAATNLTTNLAGEFDVKDGTHRHKQAGATFGPKNGHYSDPTQFQTANSQQQMPQPSRFEYTVRTKPVLDTHHAPNSAVVAARTAASHKSATKNFISENALAVIMADARRPVRGEIDYLKKEDFGKTPAYLESVRQEINSEKEYIRRVMEAEQEEQSKSQPKTHLLPEEERVKLLEQLKLKWEAVNKQYQTTTHMVTLSTGPRKLKEALEIELESIEKSIEKLSKPYVFVQAF